MRVRVRRRHGGHPDQPLRPGPRLPAAYDVLDVPAPAGHRVLLQLERLGAPLGPVLSVRTAETGRLHFLVEAGSTATHVADLKELGWDAAALDIRPIGMVVAAAVPLPAADSPRWIRPPDADRLTVPPPARLLLGSLAYACRQLGGTVPHVGAPRRAA